MSYRDRQADYMGDSRRKERDIVVPNVVNPRRRMACEADDRLFLVTYFPDRFTDAFTPDRDRILDEIAYRTRFGGDKALAAPRGGGKTSIAECRVGVKSIVTGELRFPLITAATGPAADQVLENIKSEYEDNDLLLEDYPEVCACVRALEGANQRCNMQTVRGERTRMKWSGNFVEFPFVRLLCCPKCYEATGIERKDHWECRSCGNRYQPWLSKASGALLMTRGLDAAIRGIRVGSQRPDFVMIDDPETQESAASETQIEKRERVIEKDIGGLGGPRKRVPRLLLTTLQNASCLSARYTDPGVKPSWDGERLALVLRFPEAKPLWEQYIDMRQEGMREGDKHGRKSHEFYIEHRAEMDEGAIVSNEHRFNADVLQDGTQRELSTIQHVHNEAADKGWDYVFSELQNDPPSEAIDDENKLTPFKVRGSHKLYTGRVTEDARGFVPDGCQALTAFVDVQERSLFYEIVAWYPGLRRHVVDYGNFGDTTIKDRLGVEESIKANLRDLKQQWDEHPCCGNDGAVPFTKILVDSGHEAPIVYQIVREFGSPWQASKGDGTYKHPKPGAAGKILRPTPDPLHESQVGQNRIVIFDSTWWGHRCHDSFTIQPGIVDGERPEGCVTLFGRDTDGKEFPPKSHATFGEQICAQEWQMTAKDGKAAKWEWVSVRRDNHYFDCHVGNLVAGSWLGFSVTRKKQRERITLSQMKREKR